MAMKERFPTQYSAESKVKAQASLVLMLVLSVGRILSHTPKVYIQEHHDCQRVIATRASWPLVSVGVFVVELVSWPAEPNGAGQSRRDPGCGRGP